MDLAHPACVGTTADRYRPRPRLNAEEVARTRVLPPKAGTSMSKPGADRNADPSRLAVTPPQASTPSARARISESYVGITAAPENSRSAWRLTTPRDH